MVIDWLKRLKVGWLTGSLHLLLLMIAVKSESVQVWIICLALMAVISLCAWVANYLRYRYIADTPTSRVASAAQGYVELLGRSAQLPDAPLLSRFRRSPCVWYRYRIEAKRSNDEWSIQDEGKSDDPFLLIDATGQCMIDPEGAEVVTTRLKTWTDLDYRYTEWLLVPEDQLYALGEFATISGIGATLDFDGDVGALLAAWKKDQPRLLERFDLNRDGSIDLKEWELARRQAQRDVEKKYQEIRASGDLNVMRRPADGRLFLLSNQPPGKLTTRYELWSWVHIAVFCGATAAAFALVSRL